MDRTSRVTRVLHHGHAPVMGNHIHCQVVCSLRREKCTIITRKFVLASFFVVILSWYSSQSQRYLAAPVDLFSEEKTVMRSLHPR
jgi:hypothetical protein